MGYVPLGLRAVEALYHCGFVPLGLRTVDWLYAVGGPSAVVIYSCFYFTG